MNSAFSELKQERVTALVDLVQSAGVERLCVLSSGKSNLTVPYGQTVAVACRVDCGPLEERTPVLFEPVTARFQGCVLLGNLTITGIALCEAKDNPNSTW